jgi:hypothetical protein
MCVRDSVQRECSKGRTGSVFSFFRGHAYRSAFATNLASLLVLLGPFYVAREVREARLSFSQQTIWGTLCVQAEYLALLPSAPQSCGEDRPRTPTRSAGLACVGTKISLYVALRRYYCAFAFGSGSAKCVEIT